VNWSLRSRHRRKLRAVRASIAWGGGPHSSMQIPAAPPRPYASPSGLTDAIELHEAAMASSSLGPDGLPVLAEARCPEEQRRAPHNKQISNHLFQQTPKNFISNQRSSPSMLHWLRTLHRHNGRNECIHSAVQRQQECTPPLPPQATNPPPKPTMRRRRACTPGTPGTPPTPRTAALSRSARPPGRSTPRSTRSPPCSAGARA